MALTPAMLNPRTLKFLAALLAACALLAIPTYCGPAVLEPLSGRVVIVPLFSIFIFHKLGVPGLLEHDGACGWGLCAPTTLGLVFLFVFWLGVIWLLAWALARITARPR